MLSEALKHVGPIIGALGIVAGIVGVVAAQFVPDAKLSKRTSEAGLATGAICLFYAVMIAAT